MTDDESRQIDNWFMHHTPTADDVMRYMRIRDAAKVFATAIMDDCPPSADRSAAMRQVREAAMMANASIACSDR